MHDSFFGQHHGQGLIGDGKKTGDSAHGNPYENIF
jgi:hypothetical protein